MNIDLGNKVVVVTGAAKGIGRGICKEMLLAGATVILVDIDAESLRISQEELQRLNGNCSTYVCDIRDYDDCMKMIDEFLRRYKTIDVLINNAGINASEYGILNTNREEVMDIMEINFVGPFFLTQRVLQEMVDRHIEGSVLFTSSTHGEVTMMKPAYSASKAAIEMFVKDVSLEMAEYGIRVNAVAPGAIDIWGNSDRKNPQVPMGFSGIPEDIGKAMVFLASDSAKYITGQTLTVDGGFKAAHTHYWMKKGKL